MHTRSLLLSWDSPFTTDFWFVVLGTLAKKILWYAVSGNFAVCQVAFPCSFQRYMGVAASNLQNIPVPSHSVSISLSPSHLLSQEGISEALSGISLPLHETTVAVCAVILCRALLWCWRHHSWSRIWDVKYLVQRPACFYWAWFRGSLYFHLIFQYCSGHIKGKASLHPS